MKKQSTAMRVIFIIVAIVTILGMIAPFGLGLGI